MAKTGAISQMARRRITEHPISHGAMNGHVDIVQLLLQEGAYINFKDRHGRSPLALAALNGHFALVKMLVSSNACQLLCNARGKHPIADAAPQGHDKIADYLLEMLSSLPVFPGYPKFTIQSEIQSILWYAARRGDQNRIKHLVAMGADVNFQFKFASSTPLYAAVAFAPSPENIVQLIFVLGADPNIDTAPSTRPRIRGRISRVTLPIHHAIERNESYLLIKLLLNNGADPDGHALFAALKHKKSAEFR